MRYSGISMYVYYTILRRAIHLLVKDKLGSCHRNITIRFVRDIRIVGIFGSFGSFLTGTVVTAKIIFLESHIAVPVDILHTRVNRHTRRRIYRAAGIGEIVRQFDFESDYAVVTSLDIGQFLAKFG